jgi:predicted PurR-regulated permease PerM
MVFENRRYDIFTIVVIFLILLTVFIVYFPLATPIILGMTLAVVLYPLHQRLCQRMKEAASAAAVTLIAFLVAVILLYLVISTLLSGSSVILGMVATIVQWLDSFRPPFPGVSIGNGLDAIVTSLKIFLIPLIVNIPAMVFFAFIFFLSVYLFLLKGPAVSREIRESLPGRLNSSIEKISGLTINTLYAIYIVTVEVAFLTFMLALPIFYLAGYPGFLQLSILAGLSQFVPIIGPFIVMAFIVSYEVASGDITSALVAIFIFYPIVLWFPGSYVRAKLTGMRVAIHPILLMIGIIGGISVMGISGLIFGPFFIALLISAYKILIDQMKIAKEDRDNSG